jgi:hypothetical protein
LERTRVGRGGEGVEKAATDCGGGGVLMTGGGMNAVTGLRGGSIEAE